MSAPIALTFLALQAVATASAPPPVAASVVTSAPANAQGAASPDPVMCQRVADPDNPVPKKVCHRVSVWARMARGD